MIIDLYNREEVVSTLSCFCNHLGGRLQPQSISHYFMNCHFCSRSHCDWIEDWHMPVCVCVCLMVKNIHSLWNVEFDDFSTHSVREDTCNDMQRNSQMCVCLSVCVCVSKRESFFPWQREPNCFSAHPWTHFRAFEVVARVTKENKQNKITNRLNNTKTTQSN